MGSTKVAILIGGGNFPKDATCFSSIKGWVVGFGGWRFLVCWIFFFVGLDLVKKRRTQLVENEAIVWPH